MVGQQACMVTFEQSENVKSSPGKEQVSPLTSLGGLSRKTSHAGNILAVTKFYNKNLTPRLQGNVVKLIRQ